MYMYIHTGTYIDIHIHTYVCIPEKAGLEMILMRSMWQS